MSSRVKKPLSARFGEAFDELAYAISPKWGLKRLAARKMREVAERRFDRLAWDSDTDSRVRGHRWLASGLSPDSVLDESIRDLQDRSAQLYRKNNVAHAAIEGRVTNEVGVGIVPQALVARDDSPSSQAKDINRAIEDLIKRWSEHGTDRRRQLSLGALQRLVNRSFATFGEAFVVLGLTPHRGPIGLACEVISPERVETPPNKTGDPNVRMGVQYAANGEIDGYWIRDAHPGDMQDPSVAFKFYSRFDEQGNHRVLHIFDPLFPGQSRGFPWLCAAMARIKDHDDFFEAELIAKQIEACFGLIFTKGPNGAAPMDLAEGATAERTSSGRRIEELQPGMVHYAEYGETVESVNPQRPGPTFAPFIEASLRSIAAAINFPYELLAKNFFRTTFSSGRLAMLDGRLGFRMRRQVLIESFLEPLYRRIVWEAVFVDELGGVIDLLDFVRRPWVYVRHRWQGQGWGFIDPQKEIKANVEGVDNDLTTLANIYAESGGDWEDAMSQRRRERELEVENEVAVRKLRWDLEEAAGLPHAEQQPQDQNSQMPGDSNSADGTEDPAEADPVLAGDQ